MREGVKYNMAEKQVVARDSTKLKTPWLDNVMRSIGVTAVSGLSQLYPNLTDVTSAGVKASKSIISSIRQSKATTNRITSTLKQNKYVQLSSQTIKNALKDFKAGNLAGHESGFDDMFGGLDTSSDISFGSDDAGDEGGSESYNINVDDGTKDAVLRLNDNIQRQAENTTKIAKANMDAQISMSAASMHQLEKMSGEITAHLSNINNNLKSIVEFNNQNMNKFIDASIGYYEAMGKKSEEGSTILKNEDDPLSALRNARGGIDINRYKQVVKKQARKALESVPGIGEVISSIDDTSLEMLAENPLAMASSIIGTTVTSKLLGTTLKGLETSFSNFVPVMLDKLAAVGEQEADDVAGHFKKFLAQTFGVKVNTKNSLAVAKFENKSIPFDNETKVAITEIITKELREQTRYLRIISAHSDAKLTESAKQDAEMFDYSTMKYIKVKDKRRTTADELMGNILDPLTNGKFFTEFTRTINSAGIKESDRDAIINTAKQLLKAMTESGPGLNIHDANNTQYAEAIKKTQKSAGKNTTDLVVQAFAKLAEQNPDVANQVTVQLMNARKNKNKALQDMQADPTRYGLIATGDHEIADIDEWLRQHSSLYNTASKKKLKSKTRKKINDADFSGIHEDINYGVIGNLFAGTADTLKGSMNRLMSGPLDIRAFGHEFERIFKSGAKDIGESLKKNVFSPLKEAVLGIKDENGNYQNGLLSHVRNYLGDTFKHVKYTLIGTGYTASDGTQYSDNRDSVFGTIKRGILTKLLGPEEVDENGNPTGKRTGGLFSKFKSVFSKGLDAWKEKIIGEPLDGKSEEEIQKKIQAKLNVYSKDAAVGGAVGAGVGLFAGSSLLGTLVGGPIAGAGLGIATGILSKNERFQNWLFGEKDENGERTGGFISKGVQDYIKKHKLDIIGGGAVGLLTHSLVGKGGGLLGTLVGGPIAGAAMGIATTLIARSDKMKNFLFGNPETAQKGLLPGIRDAFKKGMGKFTGSIGANLSDDSKILGMSGIGMLGGILASAVLPGGPIFGALIGLGASIAANASTFKKFLFGEDYVDEITGEKKHKHGLFGRVGNMINAEFLRPVKTQFVYWAKEAALRLEYTVGDTISFAAEAISEKVGGFVGSVKAKFDDALNNISGFIKNSILTPFADILNKAIVTPARKLLFGAAKIVHDVNEHIILAPFRAIKAIQFVAYNKLSEAWRNSKLKGLLDDGKDWLKTTIKNEIKWVGRRIVGLTKLALSPFKLAMKGIGGALKLGVYGIKNFIPWLNNTRAGTWLNNTRFGKAIGNFGKAVGLAMPRTQDQLDKMSRAERWRERRKQEKEERAKIKKEFKEQKIRDKNAKIIQKYTKGQYSSDTAEARYMAKIMSGGKASKYLDTSVETEDAITRKAREQANGVSLLGKSFNNILKIPFAKLSENSQITYVLKKIYDQITGADNDKDQFSDANNDELEDRYRTVTAAEREKGHQELSDIIKKHTDSEGNIDYDAVENEVKNSRSANAAGLEYAFSATKLKLAQAKQKHEAITKSAKSRFFGNEITMHGGVKGFLRHKLNEGILDLTSGIEKDIYDDRTQDIREEVKRKIRKLLSKRVIYLDPGETIVTLTDRVLQTGVLRNTDGDLIDIDGNLITEGTDSTGGLKDDYAKYSKGPREDDAQFGDQYENLSGYSNAGESNIIMRLRNRTKLSEAKLRNSGRRKMFNPHGQSVDDENNNTSESTSSDATTSSSEDTDMESAPVVKTTTVDNNSSNRRLKDIAKKYVGFRRDSDTVLYGYYKDGDKWACDEIHGPKEKLDALEAIKYPNGGNGRGRAQIRNIRGGRGTEDTTANTSSDSNTTIVHNNSTVINNNAHANGQRRADRILEQEQAQQKSLWVSIKENTATIKEKASAHFANWKSVFGKKGKIATALLLASPFIVKAFKWLASSPLGKIVGNIFKTLTGQDNQEGSLAEKIKNIFTDENGNSYFDNFKKTFKTEVEDIRKNGFFKWADNKLMNGPFGELYENTKSIVGAASTIALNIGKGTIELVKKINWENFATAIVKISDLMGSLINGVTGIIAKLTNKVATNTNGQSNAEHAASEVRNTFNAAKHLAPGEDFDPLQAPGTFITDEEGNWNASSQTKMNLLLHPGAVRGTAVVAGKALGVAGSALTKTPLINKIPGTGIVGAGAKASGKFLQAGGNVHSVSDMLNPKSASGFRAISGGLNYLGTKGVEHATAQGAKALEKKVAAEAAADLARSNFGTMSMTEYNKTFGKIAKKADKKVAKYEKKMLKYAKKIDINKNSLKAAQEGGAGGVLKNMITRIKETIKNFFKKIVDLVKHKGAKGTTKSVDEAEKIIKEAVEKFGPKEVGQVEKVTAEAEAKGATGAATLGVGTIVFEVGGGILGMIARGGKAGAAKLFQVSQDDVDTGMEIIAAILGGFSGTTIGAIVDVIFDIINTLTGWNGWHNIANALYNLFAGDSEEARLKDAQSNFMDEYNSYVLEQTEKSLEEAKKSGKVDKNMSVDEYKQWAEENEEVIKYKSFDDWNLEQNKTIGDKVGEKAAKIGGHIRGVTDEVVSGIGDKAKTLGSLFTGGDYGRKLFGSKKATAYRVLSGAYAGYYYRETSNGKWSLCDEDGYEQEVPPITDEELTSLIQQGILKASSIKIKSKIRKLGDTVVDAWASLFKKRDENQENSAKIATSLGEKLLDNIRKSSKLADAISKGNGLVSKIMSTDEKYLVGDGTYYKNENGKYVYYSATDEVLENPRTDEEVEQSIKSGIFIKDVTSHFDFTKIKETGAKLKEKLSNAWTDMFNNRDSVLYKVREGVTAAFSLINPIAGAGLGILKLANQYGWFDPSDGSYYVADGETYKHYNANGDPIDETVNADEVNEKIKLGLLTKEKIPLKNAAKNSLQNFKDKAKELWNKTTEATSKFFTKAKDFASSVFDTIHEKFPTVSKIVDGIVEGINNFISGIKEHATGIWNEVKDTTTGYIEDITSFWGGNGKGSKSRKKLPKGGKGPDSINGVPYYSQSDSAWSSNKYGNDGATMDDTGCGPTAMSMIASKMTGQSVLPTETASLAEMTGDRDDTGTNWNFIDKASSAYGINTNEEYMPSSDFISSELKSGKPMILSGASGEGINGGRGTTPYTDAGHYVVATGIDSNGNVDISDPRGKSYSKKYKLNDIVNQTGKAWSFDNGQGGYGKGGRGIGYESDIIKKDKYSGTLAKEKNGTYTYSVGTTEKNNKDIEYGKFSKSWSGSTDEHKILNDIKIYDKFYEPGGIYENRRRPYDKEISDKYPGLAVYKYDENKFPIITWKDNDDGYRKTAYNWLTNNGYDGNSSVVYSISQLLGESEDFKDGDFRKYLINQINQTSGSQTKNKTKNTKKTTKEANKNDNDKSKYKDGLTRDSNGGYHYTDANGKSYNFAATLSEDEVLTRLRDSNVKPVDNNSENDFAKYYSIIGGNYVYNDGKNSLSYPVSMMTEDQFITELIKRGIEVPDSKKSREVRHREHIAFLENHVKTTNIGKDHNMEVGTRLANFDDQIYIGDNNLLSPGQCTWYAESRAYERGKWKGLYDQPMGDAANVYQNSINKGYSTGQEIADDSICVLGNGGVGHLTYIEGYDEKKDVIYWSEANGDGNAGNWYRDTWGLYDVPPDGAIQKTPRSEFPRFKSNSIIGYIYTNADPYDGEFTNGSVGTKSKNGTNTSSNTSTNTSSTSTNKDSKPSILDFISQIFSRVGTALINGLFTGNFEADFSDILASIRGESSSSSSGNATIGSSSNKSSISSAAGSEYTGDDNRDDSLKTGAKGIDLSEHNTVTDYNAVKKDGVEFAILRAGLGESKVDNKFEQHYAGCVKAGIHVGAYYFSLANNEKEAQQEAKRFISLLKGKKFDMPVVVDIEDDKDRSMSLAELGKEKVSAIADAFCKVLKDEGYYPMIYGSSGALFNPYISTAVQNKYDLWVASWDVQPSLPWKIWQYAGEGDTKLTVKGISDSCVDMNRCKVDYPSKIMQAGLNGYKAGEKNSTNKDKNDNRSDKLITTEKISTDSKIIMVGDSRTVGMYVALGGKYEKSVIGKQADGNTFIAEEGKGISWFKSMEDTIISYGSGKDSAKIVIWLGINDIASGINDQYADQLAKSYVAQAKVLSNNLKNTIYFVPVGPLASSSSSSHIDKFNDKLSKAIAELKSDKIKYLSNLSTTLSNVEPGSDEVHYSADTYKKIYKAILDALGIKKGGGSGNATINNKGLALPELAELTKQRLGGISSTTTNKNVLPTKTYGGGRGTGKRNSNAIISKGPSNINRSKLWNRPMGGRGEDDPVRINSAADEKQSSSGTHDNSKHIQELKAAVGKRLADFSSEGYTSKAQCDAGQCTWYAEGRAWERAKWEGLNKGVALGNGQDVVNTVSGLGLPTGSEIADDSLASMHSSCSAGHVVYVEGVDKDNQTVYWSEANGNSDNVVSADDGVIQATPFSEWQNKNIIGYAYTDASNNYVPLGTASSTSSDASMSSSSSSSSAEDGMNFIASVFSEAGRRMSNALFTGELDTDYSGFLSGLKSSSSSSSSSSSDASFDSSSSDAASTVDGNSVKEQVWNALAGYGYSAAAIAGIMGNIERESGFDPGIYAYNGDGGGGLVQWTPWNTKIGAYSQEVKGDNLAWRNDVGLQMEYLHKTMTNSGRNDTIYSDWEEKAGMSYDEFKSISDPVRAAEAFEKVYERAGVIAMDDRTSAAQKYYDEYANKSTTKTTGTKKNGGGYGSRKKVRANRGSGNNPASIRRRNTKSNKNISNIMNKNKYANDLIKSNQKIINRGGYGSGAEDFSIESGLIDGGLASDLYKSTNNVTNNINNTSQIDPASMQQIIGLLNSIVTNTANTSNGISGLGAIKPQNIINNNSTVIQDTLRNMEAAHKPKTSLAGDSSRNTIMARKIARG